MKNTIMNVVLGTDDDVIIVDAEREYGTLARAFGGEVVEISPHSTHHLNPLEIVFGFEDENPVAQKTELITSILEQQMANGAIKGSYKSIIDRCTANVYKAYLKGKARETDYGEQRNSVFPDKPQRGEVKEQAGNTLDLLDESSVETPDSPDPALPEAEEAKQDIRGEKRFSSTSSHGKAAQKAPTGQRQTALPRNSSSAKGTKKLLFKEQGRKAARNKSVAELQKNTANAGGKAIKALGAALTKALTPSRETLLCSAGSNLPVSIQRSTG